jgi:hypothetical protein
MPKKSDKEKIAALSRAVARNEGSPVSQRSYEKEAVAIGLRRKKERKERERAERIAKKQSMKRAERILASVKKEK